jgi:hypothetical protein
MFGDQQRLTHSTIVKIGLVTVLELAGCEVEAPPERPM